MLYPNLHSLSRRLWLSSLLLHAAWTLGCHDSDGVADAPDGQAAAERSESDPGHADSPSAAADQPPSPEPVPTPRGADAPEATLEPAAFHASERPDEILPDELLEEDSGKSAPGKYGRHRGRFQLTYYWMANEKSRKSKRQVSLYDKQCKPIAKVSSRFAARLVLEGTGALSDGRVINVAGKCECKHSPCFFVVEEDHKRWGVGVADRPLAPFRSVAVDPSMVSIGTKLYIPELDGLVMPGAPPWGGFVHDGCVTADDRGGGVAGKQLDFFMVRRPYYNAFHRRHRLTQVTVHAGGERCAGERKKVLPADRNSI